MKTGEKHKTVQNTSPTTKLMNPMIETSQEQTCNNIIKISKTSICSSTSKDYVLISESFNITACDQQQQTAHSSSEEDEIGVGCWLITSCNTETL